MYSTCVCRCTSGALQILQAAHHLGLSIQAITAGGDADSDDSGGGGSIVCTVVELDSKRGASIDVARAEPIIQQAFVLSSELE